MKVVILCGGSGTRLWPLSRRSYPKQFLKINQEYSFLQKSILRFLNYVNSEDIFLVTNSDQKFLVIEQLKELNLKDQIALIFEPEARNTAAAIALSAKYLKDKVGINDAEVIFFSPSDHMITSDDLFVDYLKKSNEAACYKGVVTFGIKPDTPDTGYGYIKKGGILDSSLGLFTVDKFVEKPDIETAQKYLESGEYLWNSGMFGFRYDVIVDALKRYLPEAGNLMDLSYSDFLSNFSKIPAISIDYAVMEKHDNVSVLPLDIKWSDIGSWDTLFDILPKDSQNNVTIGNAISIDTKNSIFITEDKVIASIGVEDIILISTDDSILLAKRGESQRVKDVVKIISERRDISFLADIHTKVDRPWGYYKTLEEADRYKIKRISVAPGEKLSLQKHFHRSEHWVVVKGTAKVTRGEEQYFIHENESIYVPKSTNHRLENPGKIPLEIIEVQVGEYVEEDDIVRLEDSYGR